MEATQNKPIMSRSKALYLGYWTLGAIFVGVLLGQNFSAREDAPKESVKAHFDHSGHLTHDHMAHNRKLEVTSAPVPQVALSVTKDASAGWNLAIATQNFTFTPANVNDADAANEGHAHIYVDGEKVARLYGTDYHLADMTPGVHRVQVTLNSNSHADFTFNGDVIGSEVLITQPGVGE